MAMGSRVRRAPRTSEIWPGFVDALSTLLMVFIFLLVVFMLAQYFLS
ncbi:MAG: peptidoglycan-binding protein, partial [Alphaproteobacteria bacterium]